MLLKSSRGRKTVSGIHSRHIIWRTMKTPHRPRFKWGTVTQTWSTAPMPEPSGKPMPKNGGRWFPENTLSLATRTEKSFAKYFLNLSFQLF